MKVAAARPPPALAAPRRARRAPARAQARKDSDAPASDAPRAVEAGAQLLQRVADAVGVSLGPIGLTVGSDLELGGRDTDANDGADGSDGAAAPPLKSIATLTTAEWRAKHERGGRVDLWVQEEFNAGSRLVGGRAAHHGGAAGAGSGEGPGASAAPRHAVQIFNAATGQNLTVEVPEDRYVLHEAEEQGLILPWACRMGCCTACAVKVKSGEMAQPQALGVAAELRARGYALMCVGYALSDLVLETVEEDEVYDLQFGDAFTAQATDPRARSVLRDDFAIELAMLDE
jgi:ferredoxin